MHDVCGLKHWLREVQAKGARAQGDGLQQLGERHGFPSLSTDHEESD